VAGGWIGGEPNRFAPDCARSTAGLPLIRAKDEEADYAASNTHPSSHSL
jgi:hypothetical protein